MESLQKLTKLFLSLGAKQLICKKLSPNDNSKNQVYLGGDFSAINLFPFTEIVADKSNKGSTRDRYKAGIDFYWIGEDGQTEKAEGSQLILYPKYPEVRLSGFLKGCKISPSKIMSSRDEGRLLLFGITEDRKIYGYATNSDSPIARELEQMQDLESRGVFLFLPADVTSRLNSKQLLLQKLSEIHKQDWIKSVRLDGQGNLLECLAPNCGGYTLEAQLGIRPNGDNAPDFMGWELKQVNSSNLNKFPTKPVTLMTPEPTGGIYKSDGIVTFMKKFGYKPRTGTQLNRLNFSTPHRVGARTENTGLTMYLDGYNVDSGKIDQLDGMLALRDDNDNLAASWSFAHLIQAWNNKHLKAAYIPSECRTDPERQYRYGSRVKLGEGTDFLMFIKLCSEGVVYYDPGIKIENLNSDRPKAKKRSQFRIKFNELAGLYKTFEEVDLTQ